MFNSVKDSSKNATVKIVKLLCNHPEGPTLSWLQSLRFLTEDYTSGSYALLPIHPCWTYMPETD